MGEMGRKLFHYSEVLRLVGGFFCYVAWPRVRSRATSRPKWDRGVCVCAKPIGEYLYSKLPFEISMVGCENVFTGERI